MPHTNEDTEKEIENEEAQTEDLQPNLQTDSSRYRRTAILFTA